MDAYFRDIDFDRKISQCFLKPEYLPNSLFYQFKTTWNETNAEILRVICKLTNQFPSYSPLWDFPLMLKIKGLWLFFHFISGIFHFWFDIGQKEGLTCIVITLDKYLHSIDKGKLKCIRKGKLCIFSPNINIIKIMLKIKLGCQLYTLFVRW